jgi:hypothetical protein
MDCEVARVEALMAQTDNMVEPVPAELVVRAEPAAQAQEIRVPAAKGLLPVKLWLPPLAEQALSVLRKLPQPCR